MDILYTNAKHERNTQMKYKDQYINRDDDFYKRYFALVKNLDGDSVEAVNTILKRLEIIYNTSENTIDLFDEEEKLQIKSLNEKFYSKIFQITEDTYAYKNYLLPKKYFDSTVFYYECGMNLLKNKIKLEKGNVIDAGAFVGDTSLLFSKKIKGTVYALEALKENCEKLKKTIQLNQIDNIQIVNKAVGSKSGISYISQNQNTNWTTMVPIDCREYKNELAVEVTTIDDFVKENGLKISLIKAHVEGMESELVRGAVETLKSQKPTLLIHMHHTPEDFFGIKPFIESLDLNYSFKVYKPTNGSVLTGTMLLAEVID